MITSSVPIQLRIIVAMDADKQGHTGALARQL
jgi:hypothetical protein